MIRLISAKRLKQLEFEAGRYQWALAHLVVERKWHRATREAPRAPR